MSFSGKLSLIPPYSLSHLVKCPKLTLTVPCQSPWWLLLIIITHRRPSLTPSFRLVPGTFIFEKWMNNVCWASPWLRPNHFLSWWWHRFHHPELGSCRNRVHLRSVLWEIFYSCQDSLIWGLQNHGQRKIGSICTGLSTLTSWLATVSMQNPLALQILLCRV